MEKVCRKCAPKASPTSLSNFVSQCMGIANSVLNKGKSAIPPLFNNPEVSSASYKEKSFAEIFSKNSDLDDSGVSLPVFSSRTNPKLHNSSVTSKMVKGKGIWF